MEILDPMKLIRQMKIAAARRGQLTPELASALLKTMGHNRPLRSRRVERYRQSIREGTWIYTGQGIVIGESGRMLNGQHTCSAVVLEGVPIEILFALDVPDAAWNRMDRGQERTPSDMIEVSNRSLVAAMLRIVQADRLGSLNAMSKVTLDASDAPAMLSRFSSLIEAASWATTTRKITMASSLRGYGYWRMSRQDPVKAQEFWDRVMDGEGLTRKSPMYLFRERMMLNAASKAKLPPGEITALMIKSWTAFVSGSPMNTLRWTSSYEKFPEWPRPLEE